MKNPKRIEAARLAGVSESTVSRSLNDSCLISHQCKQKVREAAKRLGHWTYLDYFEVSIVGVTSLSIVDGA
jgi:hypothetical protein